MQLRFEEVSIKAVRRWKENGKPRQETQKFWQTMNPWNVTTEGVRKTREEILAEIKRERDEWLRQGGASHD